MKKNCNHTKDKTFELDITSADITLYALFTACEPEEFSLATIRFLQNMIRSKKILSLTLSERKIDELKLILNDDYFSKDSYVNNKSYEYVDEYGVTPRNLDSRHSEQLAAEQFLESRDDQIVEPVSSITSPVNGKYNML